MNLKKLVIPPIAIYAVIFLFISALVGGKANTEANWVWIVSLVITIVGLYLGTNYAKPKSIGEGFIYGLVWLIVLFVLDIILTVPFTGWERFNAWQSYIPYLLTLLMPTFLPKNS